MLILNFILISYIVSSDKLRVLAHISDVPTFLRGTCVNDKVCNSQTGEGKCSVCADNENGSLACLSTFYDGLWFDEGCVVPKTFCRMSCAPDSRATCEMDDTYLAACLCPVDRWGRTCYLKFEGKDKDKEDYRMYQWSRQNNFVHPGSSLFFYRTVGLKDKRLLQKYITGFGYFVLLEPGKVTESPDLKMCTYKGIPCHECSIELQFPFLLPENEYGINVLKDKGKGKLKGYLSYIEVQICVEYKDSCDGYVPYSYNVFVSYEPPDFTIECIAVIRLTNCARKLDDSSKFIFHRNEEVKVERDVTYYREGDYFNKANDREVCTAKDTTWIWTMSEFVSEDVGFKEIKEIIGRTFILDRFTTKYGTYRMNLKIKRVIKNYKNENYDDCYFQVRRLPLNAIIDGGQTRTIIKSVGIILSAKHSYDPNQPSDKQGSLEMRWSCECLTKYIPHCEDKCKKKYGWMSIKRELFVPGSNLQYNAKYKFTVHVSNDRGKTEEQTDNVIITLADESVKQVVSYQIKCIQNCLREKTLTNEILFLKIRITVSGDINLKVNESVEYSWEYSKGNEAALLPLDPMKLAGLPTRMLAIKENAFDTGTSYAIRLRIRGAQDVLAEYSFKTSSVKYEGNCSVEPQTGVKGVSRFDITCTGFSGFIYEFYDKSNEEIAANVYFSGRLLGISEFTGTLKSVRMTRGNIVIYIIDKSNRLYVKEQLKVQLLSANFTDNFLTNIKRNLSSVVKLDDFSTTTKYISVIPEILPNNIDKGIILSILLEPFSKLKPNSVADVKLSVSTLSNILQTLNKPSPVKVDVMLIKKTLVVIKEQADIIAKAARFRGTSQWMSSVELRQLATALVECLNDIFLSENVSTTDLCENDIDFEIQFTLKQNADKYARILDQVNALLCYIQAPGLPPAKLATVDNFIKIWVLGNDPDYPVSEILKNDTKVPFRPSQSLLDAYGKNEKQYGTNIFFQAELIEKNVFSWSKSDVKSKLVSVSVSTRENGKDLNKLKLITPPLLVIVTMDKNLTISIVKGNVKQLDHNILRPSDLDEELIVHRIDTPPKGFVTIRFLFPLSNQSLRVLVMEDFRPDYELMINSKDTVVINSSNPQYPLRNRANDIPIFLYMGILPGVNVNVNKSVEYEFEVTQHLCQRWIEGQWSTLGCTVSEVTASGETVCACNHLSIFAAAFPVPPQSIDPIDDAKLFLTVLDNPIVVVFVIILFIVYLLVVLWGKNKDSFDQFKGKVIVLDDNFPGDSRPYLVAVHTSARFNAGTTAHVGIKLIGKEGNSRSHILSSERRKVLTTNTDDWFMLYTPKPLGDVYGIQLWHDNYGNHPDWYCDRIIVYDLGEEIVSFFIVEQWLALRAGDFPEAHILIATDHDLLSLKRTFIDNVIIGFRESHTFLSVLVRHPRSEVTRVQRISVVMCSIMMAMLCSIMFYKPDNDNTSPSDDYRYSIGMKETIVSIETTVITACLTLIVLLSFQRSSKVVHIRRHTTRHFRKDEIADKLSRESPFLGESKSEDNSFYKNYVRYVSKYFKGGPLAPVYLWEGKRMTHIKIIWFTIAWTSCVTITLGCAYFVMLYGLKLGFVQSQLWLSSLVMSIGEDVFALGPGRIIFIAILLSMAFLVSTKVYVHNISLRDAVRAKPNNDITYLQILLAKRSHPMYAPLSSSAIEAFLAKQEIKRKWWSLCDFCAALSFVLVLSLVISRLWTSHFYDVDHLRNLFSIPHLTEFGSENINKINSMYAAENYMEITFLMTMFDLWWYNNRLISPEDRLEGIWRYWMLDFLNKPISKPLIRQVRVVPCDCNNPFMNVSKCLLEWSLWNKDTHIYGVQWAPAMYSDTIKKDNPWKYKDRATTLWWTNQRFYGVYGTLYDISGYDTFIGPTLQLAEKTLTELRENRWQDLYTRAFFATVTSYNVNVRTFSQVTLLFEYFVDGSMFGSVTVIPVSRDILLGVWELLFILYTMYYTIRAVYFMNRIGLMDYLKDVNHVTRLMIVIILYLAILVWCVHHITSIKYAEDYLKNMQDDYFDFDLFIRTFSVLQIVLSLLLCFAIARTFMLLRGGRRCLNIYYTLLISLPNIIWYTFGLTLLIFVCVRVQYHLDCHAYFRIKELILPTKMLAYVKAAELEFYNVEGFILLRLISIFFFRALLIILFIHYSTIARSYKPKDSDDFNFVTFFINRVNRFYSRNRIKENI